MEIKNVRLIGSLLENNQRREVLCKIEGNNKNIYECVEESVDKIKQ